MASPSPSSSASPSSSPAASQPGSNPAYFYSLRLDAFFEDSYRDPHGPMRSHAYQTDVMEERGVLLGGNDGYVRRYDPGLGHDDGYDFESYVIMAPQPLGQTPLEEGVISELHANTTIGSGPISWSLLVGDSIEELRREEAFDPVVAPGTASGTWAGPGRQYTSRPRARGIVGAIKLEAAAAQQWAIERIIAVVRRGGRFRHK